MSTTTVCTQNENNVFEVSWKYDSNWFTKLFCIQTEFTFVTGQMSSDWKDRDDYVCLDWCDPFGNPAGAQDVLTIKDKLRGMKQQEMFNSWVGK
ncbi:hypothetical protein VPBG_00099 [Vibrio phage helene 12B3]|uniref:hypothetical protein n=1 Tax=Vibrio phage helene 12B3 TaxID=573173 RepID=UPI0002C07C98|nr:hypothetical protein VPBG_00099 [Vibrio phage helene 12B3]AGG57871.1 hypothetical protein VPBG_00099 [Vibrio phage helene 12B3]